MDLLKKKLEEATFAQLLGTVFALLFTLFLALLLIFGNENNRMTWLGLYLVAAILTGSLFWVLNPLGQQGFSWAKLGIQFTGAAAIGAGFMAMAHQFTPPVQSIQLVSLEKIDEKHRSRPTFRLTNSYSGLAEAPFFVPSGGPPNRVLVQLSEGVSQAKFQVAWDELPSGKERLGDFVIDRDGTIHSFQERDR